MKFWAYILFFFTSTSYASTYLYLSADALLSDNGYSVQYGFSFPANNQGLYFGYELDYTKHSSETSSYGVTMKPSFRQGPFFLTPIIGFHHFTNGVGLGSLYGAEVGYDFHQCSIKVGYKETSKEFKNNNNAFIGVAFQF